MERNEQPKKRQEYILIILFSSILFIVSGLSNNSHFQISENIFLLNYYFPLILAQEDNKTLKNDLYIESISEILPPEINLIYNGSIFTGNLINYKYREGYSFDELDVAIENLSNYIPKETIQVKNGSDLKFIISGYPERIEPSDLSISVYNIENKKVNFNDGKVRILDPINGTTQEYLYKMNLPSGEYFFIVSTTTIPQSSDRVGGYAIYSYRLNII
ncbi:MAG: hypothetical protein ACE5SW_11450 [Nitrososphaeraceae archaeon]